MTHSVPPRRSTAKNTTWGGLAIAALLAVYGFARPIVNERTGWELPAISGSNAAVVESVPVGSTMKTTKEPTSVAETPRNPGPLAGKAPNPKGASPKSKARDKPPVQAKLNEAEDSDLLYGLLKDLGGDRFVSPAGLMFTRGGAEGHRLDHLERHTDDDPGRPGKHGVFDGGMEGALKTIDRAYERAQTGSRTTKEVDQGRTIYTVDMGGRVGYIGGKDGNRLKKPMARRVRIVLDQNRVITAYPL